MGGKAKVPPPPDFTPIAEAAQMSAKLSYKTAQDQLAWAKKTYARDTKMTDSVVRSFLKRQKQADLRAASDYKRYRRYFAPVEARLASQAREHQKAAYELEQGFIKDAKEYASGERASMEAGRAIATVGQQFEVQRRAAQDRLESFGIDPSQTRSAALDRSARIAQGAASAFAADNARRAVEDRGREMRGQAIAMTRGIGTEAINIGRGYPGQINQTYALAGSQGQGAAGTRAQNTQIGAQNMGNPTQWQGLGNQALGVWGDALTQGYNAQMKHYEAKQNQSSGWGSALGLIGGLGMKMFGMEEGGQVPEPEEAVPLNHDGWRVPVEASPSRGAVVDDVPATLEGKVPARLNADEFVIPRDQVMWHGEKHFQKLIEKGRKEMQEVKAKPKVMPTGPTGNPAAQASRAIPPEMLQQVMATQGHDNPGPGYDQLQRFQGVPREPARYIAAPAAVSMVMSGNVDPEMLRGVPREAIIRELLATR